MSLNYSGIQKWPVSRTNKSLDSRQNSISLFANSTLYNLLNCFIVHMYGSNSSLKVELLIANGILLKYLDRQIEE